MFLPTHTTRWDIHAWSGILGSISIACWIVVFTPQILRNYQRSSTSGLSLTFIIIWLLGDVFNILGALLQGVLPTMTALAVYYTLADGVLLGQCAWYAGGMGGGKGPGEDERGLLEGGSGEEGEGEGVGGTRVDALPATGLRAREVATLRCILSHLCALLLVCAAGVLGWWLTLPSAHPIHHHEPHKQVSPRALDPWGQLSGYLCAILYLSSRVPQIVLNARRQSTEGVSLLFFLFACVGNLTYVLSILAFEPGCEGERGGGCGRGEWGREYRRYLLVNASWLVGSAGTLGLDLLVFGQFWWFRGMGAGGGEER